jgi:hypothetical protein
MSLLERSVVGGRPVDTTERSLACLNVSAGQRRACVRYAGCCKYRLLLAAIPQPVDWMAGQAEENYQTQEPMAVTLRRRMSVAPHGASGQSPVPADITTVAAAATGSNRSVGAV